MNELTRANELSELRLFLQAAARCGQRYLTSGGPTTRLEEHLCLAGQKQGYEMEVMAIPTGIFMSARSLNQIDDSFTAPTETLIVRIKETKYDLSDLHRMEQLLARLKNGDVTSQDVIAYLSHPCSQEPEYPTWLSSIAAFLMGFFASLPLSGSVMLSTISGLITFSIFYAHRTLTSFFHLTGSIAEFFSCLLALSLSALFSVSLGTSPALLSIGALVLMAPGLTFATAVSELAEQNFVSGMTKVAKGFLTLLAMGIAYLLFTDLVTSFSSYSIPLITNVPTTEPWLRSLSIVFMVVCFSILWSVPKKMILASAVVGAMGWFVLNAFTQNDVYVISTFLASLVVGLASLSLGRFLHVPSQLFSVPGILSLVPGILALSAFNTLQDSEFSKFTEVILQVAMTAGSIVFGLFSARIPFVMARKNLIDHTGEAVIHGLPRQFDHVRPRLQQKLDS